MTAALIDGKKIAEDTRRDLALKVLALKNHTGIVPHLAAVLVGSDPASAVYVRNKERACQKAGLHSTVHRLEESATQNELLDLIAALNADSNVHGILVQLPLPPQINSAVVLDAISPSKDVDAFHPENVGLMLQGRPRFLPCTPAGVMQLLEVSGVKTAGKEAVVIGRSDIVGKPMAALLMQKGADATVTVCHSRTRDIASHCLHADLMIAAVGIPEFVTGDMIKPGAVVIDVGINRVGDRLIGDVQYDQALQVASAITPVPGGVGPMTIAMLLQNTLKAAELLSKNS